MRIPLTGKPYTSKSIFASSQRSVNLYAEINDDPQAPFPVTHYPTPGIVAFAQPATPGASRGNYRTSVGTAYAVVGQIVYFVAANGSMVQVGTITDRPSQVIMADNGLCVVLVDGVQGWVIDIATNTFGQIIDPAFYGADFVVFLDTFFVFNRPDTNQFYISLSIATFGMLTNSQIGNGAITAAGTLYTNGVYSNVNLTGGSGLGAMASITVSGAHITNVELISGGINYVIGNVLSADAADIGGTGSGFTWTVSAVNNGFDPLDIAAKIGSADPIVGISTTHKELWLIGELTTEVWIGTGAADFYFQLQQGAYIDHGCGSQFSISAQDILTFFIMQDKQGKNLVVQAGGYEVKEVSTPYLVSELNKYETVADAVGCCFQIEDHAYYCLSFPTANKTWLYDLKTTLWAEWSWLNVDNGSRNRHRINNAMFVYGFNLIGDWETGNLWRLDPNIYTDNGLPIIRTRTFMHMTDDNFDKITYKSFDADMEVGTTDQIEIGGPDFNHDFGPDFGGGIDLTLLPQVSLSWSDDRGKTFSFPLQQSLGNMAEYRTVLTWNRLGMARDRVFKLEWSAPVRTALNGAFVDAVPTRA